MFYAAFRVEFERHGLFQGQHDEFVRRADPIVGGGGAVPAEFPNMRRGIPTRVLGANGKAKSKARAEVFFISEINRERRIRQKIARHEFDRVGLQDAMSLQLATVLDHGQEPHVIPRRADESAAAGEQSDFPGKLGLGGNINDLQSIGATVIRREPLQLPRGNAEAGVPHVERLKNGL